MGWPKGKKFSTEHKAKLSLAGIGRKVAYNAEARQRQAETMKRLGIRPPNRKGAKLTNEQVIKWSEVKRGNKTHLWRGGISKQNRTERENAMSTIEYKLWRRAVFIRDNFTCGECKTRGGKLEADHIKPYALFPDLRLAIDNGRTLCRVCHLKIGWRIGKIKQWEAAIALL